MDYQTFLKLNELAQRVAEQAHTNQKYENIPYMVHLNQAQRVLKRFGYEISSESDFDLKKARVIISTWLHDVLEDTILEKKHLQYQFGEDITDLVWRVTDEKGRNRKERKLATYPKIKNHEEATIVKLADRIANVESALELKKKGTEGFYNMYKKEWKEFKSSLYVPHQSVEPMWKLLDSYF